MLRPRLALLVIALPLLAACEGTQPPGADASAAAAAGEQTSPAEAAAPAVPADAAMAPIFGTFAADLSWCGGAEDADGFPVTITPTSFEGRENICDITAIADGGDGSYEASLTCTAAGETVEERLSLVPIFAPSGEGVRITYLDRDGATATLLRCE